MSKFVQLAVGIFCVGTLSACGKANYGAGCEKASELTSPWTDLGLPLEKKQTRICESKGGELKVRSFTWANSEEAQSAFASALSAVGYAKDKCNKQACYYDKDGFTVSVHPMDFKVRKKKAQTVVLRYRKDPTQK